MSGAAYTLASATCVDDGRTFIVTLMADDGPHPLYVTRAGVSFHPSRQPSSPLVRSRLETAGREIAYALCRAGIVPKAECAA
jgi:hypothetical protein